MPGFYARFKNKLRTAEQGADTAVWQAISSQVKDYPNGAFFQGMSHYYKLFHCDWNGLLRGYFNVKDLDVLVF